MSLPLSPEIQELVEKQNNLADMVMAMRDQMHNIQMETQLLIKVAEKHHPDTRLYWRNRMMEAENMKGRHIALETGDGKLHDRAQKFTDINRKEAEKQGGSALQGFNDAHLDYDKWLKEREEQRQKLLQAKSKLILPNHA